MTRSPLTDAAAIAEYEDDIAMAAAFLTLAENQELECSRLRSENAELRATLELIARQDCVADDLKSANDLRAIANGALEK